MKYLKYLISTVLIVVVSACSTDPDLPFDLDGTLENTGAFLRVLSVESAAFDVGDPGNAAYIFVGEVGDVENGQATDRIEFFVSYDDALRQTNIPEPDNPLKTYNVSDLDIRESSGRPFGTFSITLDEILAYLPGLDAPTDLGVGDRFNIRWVVVMNDGKRFSLDDRNNAVAATSAFRSPYFAQSEVVVSLSPNLFVGDYTFEQQNPSPIFIWATQFGPAGLNDDGLLFNSQTNPDGVFTTSLSVDPENELVGRLFTATVLQEWGFGPSETAIQFGFYTTASRANLATSGLGCGGGGIVVGPVEGDVRGSFDPTNDESFTIVIGDNANTDCGFPNEDIVFEVTKGGS